MVTKPGRLDSHERAREKQASRDADAHDLATGRRTAAEISKTNSIFGGFEEGALRKARVIFPEKK